MFGFKKKKKVDEYASLETKPILVDMHSHLIFGVDDGSASIEESVEMIRVLGDLGYKKLITTPHIMADFYRNTPEILLPKLDQLREALVSNKINVEVDLAAEYYLDEGLLKMLHDDSELLTFGDNYLLFETSYMNESRQMDEAVFRIISNGYKPVLAHPERYVYLSKKFEVLEALFDKGVAMQVNINSLTGYYSSTAKEMAEKLIEKDMVSFLGSDCHRMPHLDILKKARELGTYKKASQNATNNSLID